MLIMYILHLFILPFYLPLLFATVNEKFPPCSYLSAYCGTKKKKNPNFCTLIFSPEPFPVILVNFTPALLVYLGLSRYTILSSTNKKVILSLPIFIASYSSCSNTLLRLMPGIVVDSEDTTMNKTDE